MSVSEGKDMHNNVKVLCEKEKVIDILKCKRYYSKVLNQNSHFLPLKIKIKAKLNNTKISLNNTEISKMHLEYIMPCL